MHTNKWSSLWKAAYKKRRQWFIDEVRKALDVAHAWQRQNELTWTMYEGMKQDRDRWARAADEYLTRAIQAETQVYNLRAELKRAISARDQWHAIANNTVSPPESLLRKEYPDVE